MRHALRHVVILLLLALPLACAPKAPSPVKGKPGAASKTVAPGKPAAPAPTAAKTPSSTAAAPKGFGGIAFGSPVTAMTDSNLESEIPELRTATYSRPSQPSVFAGRDVSRILYEFYDNAFYHVWIDFDGADTFLAVLRDLRTTYGPPTETIPDKHYNAWTLGDVNIYCVYHPEDGTGDASFWFQPVYLEKEKLVKAYKKAMQAAPAPAP